MNKIYKPYLILITLTLPQIIIFILFTKIFGLISSELSKSSIEYWRLAAIYLGSALIIFTLWNIRNWINKKDIQPLCALLIFIVYTIFLSVYFYNDTYIIPSDIPDYMFLGIRPSITILTLIMPVLIHSMLLLVHFSVEKVEKGSNSKDFYSMIGIPVFCYVFIYILLNDNSPIEKLTPILFIMSIVAFFFFFIRIIYRLLNKRADIWQKNLAFLNLLGSLIGLCLNQSFGNIFGDFSHIGFYLFAMITGVLMLIPDMENKRIRLILWVLKSITFVFTFYFFIVFLPYILLSLIGMIFFGCGALMLVPMLLMFLHVKALWSDYYYLKAFYEKKILAALFLIGVLTIPVFMMMIIKNDKENLDNALTFTYQRSYEDKNEAHIDIAGVKRALKNIKYVKGNKRNKLDVFTTDIPYFTSLYNEYVLDGLSISNKKIKRLEDVFLGESDIVLNDERQSKNQVFIKDIKTQTIYDEKEKVLKSWIDFELENRGREQEEFNTTFKLPKGSYISNYYLYVGNEKKYGLLADKRAADWIYQNTKAIKRDPGILTDLGNNKIAFKVFPFNGGEIRKTGIEILHKAPITINIDGHRIDLKDEHIKHLNKKEIIIGKGLAYIPKEVKKKLERTTREQKYYFLIDYSKESDGKINDYIERVKNYIKDYHIENKVEEIIPVNFEEKRISYNKEWEKHLKHIDVKGGFFLEYTIKKIFYDNYVKDSSEYPVIIVVTDDISKGVGLEKIDEFSFACPEGVYYYHLDREGKITGYSSQLRKTMDRVEKIPVLVWKDKNGKAYYLQDVEEDSIVLLDDKLEVNIKEEKNAKWENGAMLQGMYMSYMLHPEKYFEKSLSIVKNSIISHVMSPMTSFIVLENEAQEKVMLEKQKQILARKKPVHIGDMTEMDEPSLWVMLLLMGIFMSRQLLLVKSKE
ncbi:MSEP-CTERM sorting domain-containing protein [Crassaminicella indica]|uniref:MSEP-CTERM sorting domain-containing protein n=1 Tax=Crassaminicella indica TaxID=2855394 RepID=A0ABX8REC8_9CLOT|nr:MSEP-CTERM sorting domain-containing protein [Crassaminicella indica]QXM05301.1 MSEP-CTERM sorting domain-containing protein [Crassaminicella indica]